MCIAKIGISSGGLGLSAPVCRYCQSSLSPVLHAKILTVMFCMHSQAHRVTLLLWPAPSHSELGATADGWPAHRCIHCAQTAEDKLKEEEKKEKHEKIVTEMAHGHHKSKVPGYR